MNKKILTYISIIAIVGVLASCSTTAVIPENTVEPTSTPVESIQPVVSEDLGYGAVGAFDNINTTVEQMLVYAIQDEYLARSEYEFLINELDAGSKCSFEVSSGIS